MSKRIRGYGLALGLAAALCGVAVAQSSKGGSGGGVKAADFYVYFKNGRVMRVLNVNTENEWTVLILDGKNRLTVPTMTVAKTERIQPDEKNIAASSANVAVEQPGEDGYVEPPPYAPETEPMAVAPAEGEAPIPHGGRDGREDRFRKFGGELREAQQGPPGSPARKP